MNKLTALSKLASAYHHLVGVTVGEAQVADIMYDKFHYIRRSLTIEDLKPQPKSTEGLNPKGPTHF